LSHGDVEHERRVILVDGELLGDLGAGGRDDVDVVRAVVAPEPELAVAVGAAVRAGEPLPLELQQAAAGLVHLPLGVDEVGVVAAHGELPEPPEHDAVHRRVRVRLPEHRLQVVGADVLVRRRHVQLREPQRQAQHGEPVERRAHDGADGRGHVALQPDAAHRRALLLQPGHLRDVRLGRRADVDARALDVVVVDEQQRIRVQLARRPEHGGARAGAELVLVEGPVQHLVVDVVVPELALVPGEEAVDAAGHGGGELVGGQRLHPLLHRAVHLPEDAVAAHAHAVVGAELEEVVGVGVVELPLLRLRPVPLELVPEHRPVEVLGEEVHVVLVVHVGPHDARAQREAVRHLPHPHLHAVGGGGAARRRRHLHHHVALAHLVGELAEVLGAGLAVDGEHAEAGDHEVDAGVGALDVEHHARRRRGRRLDAERPADLVPPLVQRHDLPAVEPLAVDGDGDVDVLRLAGRLLPADAHPRRHLVRRVRRHPVGDDLRGAHPRLRPVRDVDVLPVERLVAVAVVAVERRQRLPRHGREHARRTAVDGERARAEPEPPVHAVVQVAVLQDVR
ncbi:Os03g0672950, partial [Oryza sativa Japonica Group]